MVNLKWMKRNPELSSLKQKMSILFAYFEGDKKISRKYKIKGMRKAAKMIFEFLDSKIRIIADYDCDGVTSATGLELLLNGLRAVDYEFYFPGRRTDGYGASPAIIRKFLPPLKKGEKGLLITVDNGITANEAILLAKELGWTVLVLDHHQPPTDEEGNIILPDADLIIDPHAGTESDFIDYCGAGLVYKLAQEILPDNEMNESLLKKINSTAMLGTIADSVKFIEESADGTYSYDNYLIVKEGLENAMQNDGRTVGLYCLLRAINKTDLLTSKDVGFSIAPILNNRLEDFGARDCYTLLSAEKDYNACDALAEKLKASNQDRKDRSNIAYPLIQKRIEELGLADDFPIIVDMLSGDVHPGIVGALAGKVAEAYQTMAIVLVPDEKSGNLLTGSARAPEGCDIKSSLDLCQDFLVKYGGHKAAAGVTLEPASLEEFRDLMKLVSGDKPDTLNYRYYDFELDYDNIQAELKEVKALAPYGMGHQAPIYKIRFKSIVKGGESYKLMGPNKNMIKFFGKNDICAVNFSGAGYEKFLELGKPNEFTLYGTLEENYFNSKTTIQIDFIDMEL